MSKDSGKNTSGKCNQKLFDHTKQSETDPLKTTTKKVTQKSAEATGDLIGNKITDEITRVSGASPQNSTRTAINETENVELDREIWKERDISPEKRKKFINDLRFIYYNEISKNNKIY